MHKTITFLIVGSLALLTSSAWAQKKPKSYDGSAIRGPLDSGIIIKAAAVPDRKKIYYNIFDNILVYQHFCDAKESKQEHEPSLETSIQVFASDTDGLQQGNGAHLIFVLDDKKVPSTESVRLTNRVFDPTTKKMKMTLTIDYTITRAALGSGPPTYDPLNVKDPR